MHWRLNNFFIDLKYFVSAAIAIVWLMALCLLEFALFVYVAKFIWLGAK